MPPTLALQVSVVLGAFCSEHRQGIPARRTYPCHVQARAFGIAPAPALHDPHEGQAAHMLHMSYAQPVYVIWLVVLFFFKLMKSFPPIMCVYGISGCNKGIFSLDLIHNASVTLFPTMFY